MAVPKEDLHDGVEVRDHVALRVMRGKRGQGHGILFEKVHGIILASKKTPFG